MNCDPTDTAPPFNLANLFWATGRKIEAAAALRAATRTDPTFAEARYNLSNLLDEQGRSEAAIDCLRRALQAALTTPRRCLNLRFCYSEVVGTRKWRSTGGDTSQLMLNLNGQHGRVDP
jgi:tetratricopeptide (TPR) repeat protein